MPELPEVETVRLGLQPIMQGAIIANVELRRPDLRVPFPRSFARRLTGRRIIGLGRRGKYLLLDLDDDTVLVMHLGMSGSFRIEASGAAAATGRTYHRRGANGAHDHVVFHLLPTASVIFNDPRRFGLMDLVKRSDLSSSRHFRAMGVEPLGNALDGRTIAGLFDGSMAPLKAALMDQRKIAGLGNIYACEALWRARLSPLRPAGTLAGGRGRPKIGAVRLAEAIRAVLAEAVAAGGSSLRDHRRTSGELGTFQHAFAVYDREGQPCRRSGCAGIVRRAVQSGRSTFYCPRCQR